MPLKLLEVLQGMKNSNLKQDVSKVMNELLNLLHVQITYFYKLGYPVNLVPILMLCDAH